MDRKRTRAVRAIATLVGVAIGISMLFAAAPGAYAMGAQCPSGVNLYDATFINATVTYQDAYSHHSVTVDLLQQPNATLDIAYNPTTATPAGFSYSSNLTVRTSATPYSPPASPSSKTGSMQLGGENGEYGYSSCEAPVKASTVYSGLSIEIVHPATMNVNNTQIQFCAGGDYPCDVSSPDAGASATFWVHWVNEGAVTTTSSASTTVKASSSTTKDPTTTTTSSSSSSYPAPEFPASATPVILLAAMMAALVVASKHKFG